MENKDTLFAIEGILFAAGEPVGVERLCMTLGMDKEAVSALCQQLADQYSYDRRGLRVIQMDDTWQMVSAPEYAPIIRQAFESRKPAKLSQPALEVLSIIAYFQPTTRAYVDQVRGVDSSYTVGLLQDRDLIEEAGRLAVPGRPILYRTTRNFLRSFNLSSLDDLPELPAAAPEDGQLTMEIQANIQKLLAEQGDAAEVSDEELIAAATQLAQAEAASAPEDAPQSTGDAQPDTPAPGEGDPPSDDTPQADIPPEDTP